MQIDDQSLSLLCACLIIHDDLCILVIIYIDLTLILDVPGLDEVLTLVGARPQVSHDQRAHRKRQMHEQWTLEDESLLGEDLKLKDTVVVLVHKA